MAERIGVFYSPVKGVPGAYHSGVFRGTGYGVDTLEALPEHDASEVGGLSALFELAREKILGERPVPTPFGRIVTRRGTKIPDGAIVNPLVEGLGLLHDWYGLESTFDEIANSQYPYYPGLQNSNSVVAAALARNGIRWTPPRIPTNPRALDFKHGDPPYRSDPNFPWVPGADRTLIREQDVQRPRYEVTPIGDMTGFAQPEPQEGVSAGAVPATPADTADTFDDRFGNWGSSRAGSFGSGSPVLRELRRYRQSALPRDPQWNSQDGGGSTGIVVGVPPAPYPNLPNSGQPYSEQAFAGGAPDIRYVSSERQDIPVNASSRRLASRAVAGPANTTQPASPPLLGLVSGQPMQELRIPWLFGLD